MKAIILISSIFYILGLKISHKIDLLKHHSSKAEKVITYETKSPENKKTINMEEAKELKPEKDSLAGGGAGDMILENK